jgi:CRISPR/Cas system-associated protein Cas10 (large subunit of type III CRISPR-Cas system)
MNCPPEYITKSRFHEKYLKQYLREFGLFYKKERPKTIEDKTYLDALIIKMQINQSFIESEVFIRYLGRDVEKAIAVWFGGIGDLGNTSHKPN